MATGHPAIDALIVRLEARGRRVTSGLGAPRRAHAEFIRDRGRENAPVVSGTLRDSIVVEDGPDPNQTSVAARAPYAAAVHNRPAELDQAHIMETTPEGYRGAGFLERPLVMHRSRFPLGVAEHVRTALGGAA